MNNNISPKFKVIHNIPVGYEQLIRVWMKMLFSKLLFQLANIKLIIYIEVVDK